MHYDAKHCIEICNMHLLIIRFSHNNQKWVSITKLEGEWTIYIFLNQIPWISMNIKVRLRSNPSQITQAHKYSKNLDTVIIDL